MNKRILFVVGTLDVGGAETHLVRIARELKQRAWEPEVFVLNPGGPLTAPLIEAGVGVRGIDCGWCRKLPLGRTVSQQLLTMIRLIGAMRSFRPSVCHFFLPGAYVIGGIAAIIAGMRPRIMSRRSLRNYQQGHPLFTFIEHRLHPRMDLVCGNSRAVIAQLEEEGVPHARLRLIYNGIELSPAFAPGHRNEKRAELGVPTEALVLTMVANLIPYKGHADLIDALALAVARLPAPWRLLCLGRDDGIGGELRSRAERTGIAGNILWLGSRRDVPQILAASDIGLLASHQEGFSNAVLEGMAAALPMVVTDVGGNAEAVVDGETGYVVPARSPRLLAEAILRLATNAERGVMGERGRERIGRQFSLAACVDAYEMLYEEAVSSRGRMDGRQCAE